MYLNLGLRMHVSISPCILTFAPSSCHFESPKEIKHPDLSDAVNSVLAVKVSYIQGQLNMKYQFDIDLYIYTY